MPEQQNIEYKSSWHDDYLDWVCGFAVPFGSAQGTAGSVAEATDASAPLSVRSLSEAEMTATSLPTVAERSRSYRCTEPLKLES